MNAPTYFDAVLLEVCADDRLLFEYQGRQHQVPIESGLGRLAQPGERPQLYWCSLLGQTGVICPTGPANEGGVCHYRFEAYRDQTLRRAYELDRHQRVNPAHQRNEPWIGWRDERHPEGFLAPRGILPGVGGDFIADLSERLTVTVPLEFRLGCERYHLAPKQVLQGFMADAAELENLFANPRADGFGSHGSDERLMEGHYLERAYGYRTWEEDPL